MIDREDTSDLARRVPAPDCRAAVEAARGEGFPIFDWLGCVDQLGREDAFMIIVRLARLEPHWTAVRLSTLVPRDAAELDSIGDLFAGAGWHERESTDLFGVTFRGVPYRPLLIEQPFAAPPLRKDQVLAARSAIGWPGAKEPGEGDDGTASPSRRRMRPPGVPDAEVWGDRVDPHPPTPVDVEQSTSGGRVRRRRSPDPRSGRG